MEGAEFFGVLNGGGGSESFLKSKKETFFLEFKNGPEFLDAQRGDLLGSTRGEQKKLNIVHHKQTVPLPVKNHSSLT